MQQFVNNNIDFWEEIFVGSLVSPRNDFAISQPGGISSRNFAAGRRARSKISTPSRNQSACRIHRIMPAYEIRKKEKINKIIIIIIVISAKYQELDITLKFCRKNILPTVSIEEPFCSLTLIPIQYLHSRCNDPVKATWLPGKIWSSVNMRNFSRVEWDKIRKTKTSWLKNVVSFANIVAFSTPVT